MITAGHKSAKTGTQAIADMFTRARSDQRAAFLPYYPIGYPDYETSLETIVTMANAGVDGFEIGMPFSDPLADGPTIQAATQIALQNGVSVQKCLEAVEELRGRGVTQPMLMMGYLNPILAYGIDEFVSHARAAGANGLIVPDIPPDEAHWLAEACRSQDMALVFFLAPTSNEARIRLVASQATGFIYLVSLTGVTGARTELPADLTAFTAPASAPTPTNPWCSVLASASQSTPAP